MRFSGRRGRSRAQVVHAQAAVTLGGRHPADVVAVKSVRIQGQAGRELFAERPVDAVAIDDIVRKADVAKGSFYNHFADREALVAAITDDIRLGLEAAIDAANDGVEDPARRVARWNTPSATTAMPAAQMTACRPRICSSSCTTRLFSTSSSPRRALRRVRKL